MPVYKVTIRAQFENVTNLEAPGEDFSEKWQYVSADEQVDTPKSRGTCNMAVKCKLCNRHSTLDVLRSRQQRYTAEDIPNFKEIIAFECRGISVVNFKFGDGWQCQGTDSKTPFTNLSLDEEWCEYDENANCPVGISELEYKID
ncbi:CXXC motif containing zinc binding protein-like [Homarus americanus]|uniref:CXXC motif containing zinc binding protein-like n=1 Tax=Homarus americanus TaxID=6706 RepID=A0A8J5K4Z3_HOMAM|nr:CXXC motif containing zinc binding protein-like [Homarus americanus]